MNSRGARSLLSSEAAVITVRVSRTGVSLSGIAESFQNGSSQLIVLWSCSFRQLRRLRKRGPRPAPPLAGVSAGTDDRDRVVLAQDPLRDLATAYTVARLTSLEESELVLAVHGDHVAEWEVGGADHVGAIRAGLDQL
jgi:hypothetical protein